MQIQPEVPAQVRFATRSDLDAIVQFLAEHWSSNHVFVREPALLLWQHGKEGTENLNFVLALDRGQIQALIGFIPASHFDQALSSRRLALAIWKVRSNATMAGAGIQVYLKLIEQFRPSSVIALGISEVATPVYRKLGYEIEDMRHLVLPNPQPPANFLKRVPPTHARRLSGTSAKVLDPLMDQTREWVVAVTSHSDTKSWGHVQARYLSHPTFRYELVGLESQDGRRAILVVRSQPLDQGSAWRVVDVLGDPGVLSECAGVLEDLVRAQEHEYLDLYELGLDPQVLHTAGFLSPSDEFVVPNYFAPFEMKNVTIRCAIKVFDSSTATVPLYRADSDQDRPN